MIQYINIATPIILFLLGIVASIIAWSIKTNIKDVKSDISEIKNSVKDLEIHNSQSHKEIWLEINSSKERIVRAETKINGGR